MQPLKFFIDTHDSETQTSPGRLAAGQGLLR
jgi:hypothetical protein